MKTYRWVPETSSIEIVNGTRTTALRPSLRYADRFACGDRSLLSLETAFSILNDCLGPRAMKAKVYNKGLLIPVWHAFYEDKIFKRRQRQHWEIREDEIKAWLYSASTAKPKAIGAAA